ncbi:hypothetical protein L3Q82_016421 [Scortum barcoo]|uniref:Uncharacterized protein n=1 Tax=Scortum barcoo TaxID=214431 RepID=A0ACB8X9V6_9TELE|nr:hypothetical protein L3Q82_016421 [Scortum barcoo]
MSPDTVRLSFLYCLYQRLLAGCVLLHQPQSILGNFTWEELCDVITEQVEQLTSDLRKANDKVVAVHGRVFAHGTRPGSARNGGVGPPSSRLTTRRKVHEGPVQCGLGSSRGREPRRPIPGTKLWQGNRDMECHLTGGKEPELVREVERYRLEIVGLTSTHSLGSGTQLLERGWTLHYSGVAQGERWRAGVGLLYSSPAQPPRVGVHPVNERVASLRLRVGIGLLLCCLCLRAEQQYRVPGLLGVPGRGT